MKTLSFIISLLLLLLVHPTTSAQNVGDEAEDFTLTALNDDSFTLSAHKGKVIFIFFFGYNCSTCEQNGPNTEVEIYQNFKSNPEFLAIGVDVWNGNESAVQNFKSTTGITYPLLLNGSALQAPYGVKNDRVVVIDKQGKIQYRSSTVANITVLTEVKTIIANLLEEGSTGIFESEVRNKTFNVSPNRTENFIHFNNPFEQQINSTFQVVDLTGKKVIENTIQLSISNTIDASSLLPGYYTIVLKTDSDYRIARFIKTF